MNLVRCIYSIVGLCGISIVLGMLCTRFTDDSKNNFVLNIVLGTVVLFALTLVVALPSTLLELSFRLSFRIFFFSLIMLLLLSVILNVKRFGKMKQCFHAFVLRVREIIRLQEDSQENVFVVTAKNILKNCNLISVAVIITMLLIMALKARHTFMGHHDDAFYVATATTAIHTDTLFRVDPYTGALLDQFNWRYVMSPFPIFFAYMSLMFNVHPAIFSNTILPIVLYGFSIGVYYSLGRFLFKDDKWKASSFLLVFMIFQILAPFSQAQFALLLLRWGKSLVYTTMIPLCIYWVLRINEKEKVQSVDLLLLLMILLATSMVSGMGIIFGLLSVCIAGLTQFLQRRNFRTLLLTALCCFPNVLFGILFLLSPDLLGGYY